MKKRTISLVTGGAGFIGSHVVDHLLKMNHNVIVLDDLSGGFLENVNQKATLYKGSITDIELVNKIFKEHKIDYIYHLAAYAAEGLSHFIKNFNYTNNLIGSINLINCAVNNNVKCFVFTSSIAVYGHNQVPMKESMVPQPEDPYGISKYAVELELIATKKMFDLDYIIFRPHNVYGERQNIGDKYRNVIGIFINNAMNKEKLPIFGDGEQQRAFSYIDDVAPIVASSIKNKKNYNNIFNIGSDHPHTVNELAEIIKEIHNEPLEKEYHPVRNEVKVAYSDHSKIADFFRIKKYTNLKDGVDKMYKWAVKNGARKSKKFGNIEISKNLPPSWNTL